MFEKYIFVLKFRKKNSKSYLFKKFRLVLTLERKKEVSLLQHPPTPNLIRIGGPLRPVLLKLWSTTHGVKKLTRFTLNLH